MRHLLPTQNLSNPPLPFSPSLSGVLWRDQAFAFRAIGTCSGFFRSAGDFLPLWMAICLPVELPPSMPNSRSCRPSPLSPGRNEAKPPDFPLTLPVVRLFLSRPSPPLKSRPRGVLSVLRIRSPSCHQTDLSGSFFLLLFSMSARFLGFVQISLHGMATFLPSSYPTQRF